MKNKVKKLLMTIYHIVFYIAGILLPKNEKIIIFESFLGKQYSDNPRAIYEYMLEHHPGYKMYWSFEGKSLNSITEYPITPIKRFSIEWLLLMNRAKYWVSNSRMPLWIPKPDKTVYIQTWHGTPLKKLATDMDEVHMPGTDTKNYKENFTTESSKWDYLISPNAYSTIIFKRAFQFENKVVESGYPRNDYLYQKNHPVEKNRIKKVLNLPKEKKIILYAPTWRDNQYYSVGSYKFELSIDLKQMYDELSEDYILLLRTHYLVAENLEIDEYKGFVFDVSNHEDIRELYLISDMLVTDYSSVFFDYANLKRPILFFVYDIEEYRDKLRGFYFDFEEEAPGPLVRTTNKLIEEIEKLDKEFKQTKKIQTFYDTFCYLEDGNATKRVVEEIFKSKE